MSSTDIPSKVEVMRWNHQRLADYLRRHRLPGCDKAVLKGSITGAQFLKMTEGDLQVFPCVYIPKVTQIQRDINESEQKKGSGYKLRAQSEPKQAFVQEEESWNSDEFDNDSLHEGSQSEDEDKYLYPLNEPQTDEPYDSGEDYEIPSAEEKVKPSQRRAAPRPHTQYKDDYHKPTPVERHSKLSQHQASRMSQAPSKPKIPGNHPGINKDRSNKPGQCDKSLKKSKGSTVEASGSLTPKGPVGLFNRASKYISHTLTPTQPPKTDKSIPGQDKCFQGLDPSWYAGKITRHQAEVALREMNEDGAFMVRDSSQGSDEHPYTLMLLKQGKVYNIKIQNQGKSYILGTGLNNKKSFPGVKEMITHHMHNPLQLIDATDPNQEQNHCCLLRPVGL